MDIPGSGTPPQIFGLVSTCSITGTGTLNFSVNKGISGSLLSVDLRLRATGNPVWQGGFGEYKNAQAFEVVGVANGDYDLVADNGENTKSVPVTVDCTPLEACDLAIIAQPTAAQASTGVGYLTLSMKTSHYPINASYVGPQNGTLSQLMGSTTVVSNLLPGGYTFTFIDKAGCKQVVTTTIGPPPIPGCMDKSASNYNEAATVDDGSCILPPKVIYGCTNKRARNYNEAATIDDNSCEFGPLVPVTPSYDPLLSVALVYNESEAKWMSEQTSRPQELVPVEGAGIHALPLPGQSNDRPGSNYLWEHNAGPAVPNLPGGDTTPDGVLLYGRRHKIWLEVILLGAGTETIKVLDNLVLASGSDLPVRLEVTAPEQGSFTQELVAGRTHLTTVERQEQLTYMQLNAPEAAPWGGRVRAPYVRLRLYFQGRQPARLSKLFAILRESLT